MKEKCIHYSHYADSCDLPHSVDIASKDSISISRCSSKDDKMVIACHYNGDSDECLILAVERIKEEYYDGDPDECIMFDVERVKEEVEKTIS